MALTHCKPAHTVIQYKPGNDRPYATAMFRRDGMHFRWAPLYRHTYNPMCLTTPRFDQRGTKLKVYAYCILMQYNLPYNV